MSASQPSRRTVHVPVLLHEVLEQLDLQSGLTILDGTVGAGGHSSRIVNAMATDCRLIGLDRDSTMLTRAAEVVTDARAILKQASYAELPTVLEELGIRKIDRALVDLGLSSDQLADEQRGFGFDTSGKLDMRFDERTGQSAVEFLQTTDLDELTRIFEEYGEERHSKRIAQTIIERRNQQRPVTTTSELVELVIAITGQSGKSNPATRVFQALRIAVNQELEHLQYFLTDGLPGCLNSGGRALVITFHSLEDRLVKQAFRDTSTWDNLTRKPITATPSEVRMNPRSRSAKLRVAVRK